MPLGRRPEEAAPLFWFYPLCRGCGEMESGGYSVGCLLTPNHVPKPASKPVSPSVSSRISAKGRGVRLDTPK